MSSLEFRRPTTNEFDEYIRVPLRAYGADATDDDVAHERHANEIDRSYGALDDGRWVSSAGAYSYELTLPGGHQISAAGITMIAVAPTHRRKGVLTSMLQWLHDDAVRRGEPIAILTATETSIYRRFGYGIATECAFLRIPSRAVVFDPPLDDHGSFDLFDPHLESDAVVEVFERVRRVRAGWISRSPGAWTQIRNDPPAGRNGRTPLRGVIHRDRDGVPDGTLTWRIAMCQGPDRNVDNTLHIEELAAATPEVEAALWEFAARIDLVTSVVWAMGPLDPVIRWRLVEPRQLRTEQRFDLVWARILDVPTVLTARSYATSATLTLSVHDRTRPENTGVFRLTTATVPTGNRCERLAAAPETGADLELDIADLSSIALGGIEPSALASSGRIRATYEVIGVADRVFPHRPATHWPVEF